jgi:hypothetical protein
LRRTKSATSKTSARDIRIDEQTADPDNTGFSVPVGFILDGTECGPPCSSNGTAAASTYDNAQFQLSSGMFIESISGSAFTFAGFDGAEGMWAAPSFLGTAHWAGRIRVDATRVDLTVLTQFFDLDGFSDGPGGVAEFQSFASASSYDVFVRLDFSGAPSAEYQGRDFFIDNIAVSEVPEPASLLWLATGLAAVGRRRMRSR